MGHEVCCVAVHFVRTARQATNVPFPQSLVKFFAGNAGGGGRRMAVDRVRLGRIRKVGIGGEHVFPLCIADVVKEGRRRRLGGERLVVVDDVERFRLV